MPGTPSSYLNTGNSVLDKLLNQPIPGAASGGFDTLSEGYEGAEESGTSDIASRGLTTTGAGPTMISGLNQQYRQGATQVNAQATEAQQAQRLKILSTLLGLGGAGLNVSRAGAYSTEEDVGAGGDILEGLFGTPASGGLFPFTGGPGSLLSQLSNGRYGVTP